MPDGENTLQGIELEQLHPLAVGADDVNQIFEAGYTHRTVQRFEIPISYTFNDEKHEENLVFKNGVLIIRDDNQERFELRNQKFIDAVQGMHGVDKVAIYKIKEIENFVPVANQSTVRGAMGTSDIKSATQNKPVVPPSPTGIKLTPAGIQPKV